MKNVHFYSSIILNKNSISLKIIIVYWSIEVLIGLELDQEDINRTE